MCLFKNHFQKNVNICSLNVDVVNLKWKFIYLGRRPSPSPLLSPDVLADVDVVDLKLSICVLKTARQPDFILAHFILLVSCWENKY
jgi:hypothetical protein